MERRSFLRLPALLILGLAALAPLLGARQDPSVEKNLHADLFGPAASGGDVDVRGAGTQRYVKVFLFKVPVSEVRVVLDGASFPVRIDPATRMGTLVLQASALGERFPELAAEKNVFVVFNGRVVMRGVLKPVP